jgi:hypothetical protein
MNCRLSTITIVLLLLSLCLVSCEGGNLDESEDIAKLGRMETQILAFIGNAQCTDSTDCRYIAFGDKPCGGPWKYLIYSAATIDTMELQRMVASYNEFNEILNHRYAWRSDCSLAYLPNVGCQEGTCVDLGWHQ